MITLKGLTWDDPRGTDPLHAVTAAFADQPPFREVAIDWSIQPLSGFESAPLSELTKRYDLLIVDHPHIPEAAELQLFAPFDAVRDDFVGRCLESYRWRGRLWALPVDAACHVAAHRADLAARPATTWDDVFAMVDDGLRVCAALKGVHSLLALFCVLATRGITVGEIGQKTLAPDRALIESLLLLRRLAKASPRASLQWNPIEALKALAASETDYVAITFGYAHFQNRGVRFRHVPSFEIGQASYGVLGGAGIAVSARSANSDVAREFARFAASRQVQVQQWPTGGGQPAHRRAWQRLAKQDPFYDQTCRAVETALLRPRFAGWNQFQTTAGAAIHRWLGGPMGDADALSARLQDLWQAATSSSVGDAARPALRRPEIRDTVRAK